MSSLLVDLYQLTMAQAYWLSGHNAKATFSLYFRTLPEKRGLLVFAGLEDALTFLENLMIEDEVITYLDRRGDFTPQFLEFLTNFRFTGTVRAMAEGTPCFPGEPVIEVTAPVIEAQIAETYLLNQINLQTTLATKASRVVMAARGRSVIDFAARRVHGTEAAMKMARVGYLAGFDATSNVGAAHKYGIPASGTMAHSFITSFDNETEAFRAYVRAFPNSATLLVDTYDTLQGVSAAITVAHEIQKCGGSIAAIRLDSGDLEGLSRASRTLLDEARLTEVRIVGSGNLDEHAVDRLVTKGAPIDVFGVGTAIGTSKDAPSTDSVYKMVEYDSKAVMKLTPVKRNLPGQKQVYRQVSEGVYSRDLICLSKELPPEKTTWTPLLEEVMLNGVRIGPPLSILKIRDRFADRISRLPTGVRHLLRPVSYPVSVSGDLDKLALVTERSVNS